MMNSPVILKTTLLHTSIASLCFNYCIAELLLSPENTHCVFQSDAIKMHNGRFLYGTFANVWHRWLQSQIHSVCVVRISLGVIRNMWRIVVAWWLYSSVVRKHLSITKQDGFSHSECTLIELTTEELLVFITYQCAVQPVRADCCLVVVVQ